MLKLSRKLKNEGNLLWQRERYRDPNTALFQTDTDTLNLQVGLVSTKHCGVWFVTLSLLEHGLITPRVWRTRFSFSDGELISCNRLYLRDFLSNLKWEKVRHPEKERTETLFSTSVILG